MCKRERCGECGHLIPSDSDLAVRVIVTTGRNRALLGRLFSDEEGRSGGAPSTYCPRCFLAAAARAIESLERATTLI